MHLRSLRLGKTSIPVKDASRRRRAIQKLRKVLHPAIRITSSSAGITIEGEFLSVELDKIDKISHEVSDWVRSSRRYR